MKKIKNVFVYMSLILVFMVSGCVTKFVNDSGKELPASLGYSVQVIEAANTVYDTALSVAGDLHCNKKITDEQAMKIIDVGNKVYLAINTSQLAVDGWYRAIEIKGDTGLAKNTTYMQLINLSKNVVDLIKDYEDVTGKKITLPSVLIQSKIVQMFGGK